MPCWRMSWLQLVFGEEGAACVLAFWSSSWNSNDTDVSILGVYILKCMICSPLYFHRHQQTSLCWILSEGHFFFSQMKTEVSNQPLCSPHIIQINRPTFIWVWNCINPYYIREHGELNSFLPSPCLSPPGPATSSLRNNARTCLCTCPSHCV